MSILYISKNNKPYIVVKLIMPYIVLIFIDYTYIF